MKYDPNYFLMTDSIAQIAKRLKESIDAGKSGLVTRLGSYDRDDEPKAHQTLSNTLLLLDTLVSFFSDPKSDFFPAAISKIIRDSLIQAENSFSGLPVEDQPIPEDAAVSVLKLLENLYVYALQYGLISFGFTGKIAQEQIEVIRSSRQQADSASKKMLALLSRHDTEITNRLGKFENTLVEAEASLSLKVADQLNALQPSIDGLAAIITKAEANATEIGNFLTVVGEHASAVASVRVNVDAAAVTATEEAAARKIAADADLATIASLSLQVQKFESDVKAMHQAVTDTRAKMTDQMEQITNFYGEIEKYRAQITAGGKDAESNLASLRKNSQSLVDNLTDRTTQVIDMNESLIGQIKEHLNKAIGISLFTAFDNRRKNINVSSWIWAALLLLSIGGTIGFAFWFVSEVAVVAENAEKAKSEPSNFVWILAYSRLVIVAPLAFLVTFTAKRYTSERRAEEEWAFKSAISVSLEPFRDLIARMKVEGQETAFVERLVAEIFDNPTKRLYGSASEKSDKADTSETDVLGIVKDALEKIPKSN